ncbi:polyamine-modulated factor 1-binding protein 1 [Sorex fumeus]|uniref:polyamine-modulated factor 1-binding protein 1 n=1 Tax=Sorex fumeus TaxID=62283 RepID=UPI0024ACDE87|nr:polyamine-modulated factor 1-binding protein 1 [Sorex fumeus]
MANNNHELQTEFEPTKQCHLQQLQRLKKKLLSLQQELELRTQELQTSYCSLLQYQSVLQKQTSDLVLLHHHCKMKENEVILYEEEMGGLDNTGEKLVLAQEQLALAGDRILSLERSLSLYRDKYQTSLSNIELLECQVKMLEGELSGIISQDPKNQGDHAQVQISTAPCMVHEHQETLKRLSEVWHKVSEQDDLIQELRDKLACSNALVLEREEALIKLQTEFVSYTAVHRHPPESSEDYEDIKKILKHLQEQKDSQCLHVEEYQNLVKDLRLELEAVSQQKKVIMKDVMKLELAMHELREETAAHMERKDQETTCLQRQLQELQLQFTESQNLGLKKDQLLQEKDEMQHQLEKELAQFQTTLMKKEVELEEKKQELETAKCKAAECETLRAETQRLTMCLDEIQQQQILAAQHLATCQSETLLTKGELDETQKKLQSYIFVEQQKEDTIQELQKELRKLQEKALVSEEELSCNRKKIKELSSELCETLRNLEKSDKEKRQLETNLAKQDLKLNEVLDHIKLVQHQKREQDTALSKLEDDFQKARKSLEDKQEQLKKSKEKEKFLELELEAFQEEGKKKEKMLKDCVKTVEEEKEALKVQITQISAQLDASMCKLNNSQKINQDLKFEITTYKETFKTMEEQLEKAEQREKQCNQNSISKELHEDLCRKSAACKEELALTLEKLNNATTETKSLHRSLLIAHERRNKLEGEIVIYEERMKKVNGELKKLQSFHQQSEIEVQAFDKRLEDMSNQVLQWQKQHQADLQMLACKEKQLKAFQEEMMALKESLLMDGKEICCLRNTKETCRIHQENEQIMCNVEQWAKEQKIENEKLGNKLREQVKYIAKLTGEKDHLHNVMVHLQQENKKLKSEIEERRLRAMAYQGCAKAPTMSKVEHFQRERVHANFNCRGASPEVNQRVEVGRFWGMSHCSGSLF